MSQYVLSTGEEAEARLQLVDEVHGPDTERFLLQAGLKTGMQVAELGCGAGLVSVRIARRLQTAGQLTAIDINADQVEVARKRIENEQLKNVRFQVSSATQTTLESNQFDMVTCRFLLMHLSQPNAALHEMIRILKPGGILAVEEGDFSSLFCWQAVPAFQRCMHIYRLAGERQGENFDIGQSLFQMIRSHKMSDVKAQLVQPLYSDGIGKTLPLWTLKECSPFVIENHIASREEVGKLAEEIKQLEQNPDVLMGMARMTQVWAKKPFSLTEASQ